MTTRPLWVVATAIALACPPPRADAAFNLLSPSNESQLEAWLGQGDLDFTRVFGRVSGDGKTATQFHAAVDGKGATFTLLTAMVGAESYVIGGYNPQSWNSTWSYNQTVPDAARTAFLFNLTTGDLQRQNLTTTSLGQYSLYGDVGRWQTYNASGYGPIFGNGHDLVVNGGLSGGTTQKLSYGGVPFESDLLGRNNAWYGTTAFTSTQLEVYTFAPASALSTLSTLSTPTPPGALLAGIGAVNLLAVGWWRKRRTQKAGLTAGA